MHSAKPKSDLQKATDYLLFIRGEKGTEFKHEKFQESEELYFVYLLLKFENATNGEIDLFEKRGEKEEEYKAIQKIVIQRPKEVSGSIVYKYGFTGEYRGLNSYKDAAEAIIRTEGVVEVRVQRMPIVQQRRKKAAEQAAAEKAAAEKAAEKVAAEKAAAEKVAAAEKQAAEKAAAEQVSREAKSLANAKVTAITDIKREYAEVNRIIKLLPASGNKINIRFEDKLINESNDATRLNALTRGTFELLDSMKNFITCYNLYLHTTVKTSRDKRELSDKYKAYIDCVTQYKGVIIDEDAGLFCAIEAIGEQEGISIREVKVKAELKEEQTLPVSHETKAPDQERKQERTPIRGEGEVEATKVESPQAGLITQTKQQEAREISPPPSYHDETKAPAQELEAALQELQNSADSENVKVYQRIVSELCTNILSHLKEIIDSKDFKEKGEDKIFAMIKLVKYMREIVQNQAKDTHNVEVCSKFFKLIADDSQKLFGTLGLDPFIVITKDLVRAQLLSDVRLTPLEEYKLGGADHNSERDDDERFLLQLSKKTEEDEKFQNHVKWNLGIHKGIEEKFLQEYNLYSDKVRQSLRDECRNRGLLALEEKTIKIENAKFELTLLTLKLTCMKKNKPEDKPEEQKGKIFLEDVKTSANELVTPWVEMYQKHKSSLTDENLRAMTDLVEAQINVVNAAEKLRGSSDQDQPKTPFASTPANQYQAALNVHQEKLKAAEAQSIGKAPFKKEKIGYACLGFALIATGIGFCVFLAPAVPPFFAIGIAAIGLGALFLLVAGALPNKKANTFALFNAACAFKGVASQYPNKIEEAKTRKKSLE